MLIAFVFPCLLFFLGGEPSHALSQSQMSISGMIPDYGNATTAAAAFHCDYRGQDSDLGIASPFCECGEVLETELWPIMTPSASIAQDDISSQCAYTAAPACLSCTSMGYYNGKCVSITACNTLASSNIISAKATSKDQPASLWTSPASISSGAPADSSNFIAGHITTAPLKVSRCETSSSMGSYSTSTYVLRDAHCSLESPDHALPSAGNNVHPPDEWTSDPYLPQVLSCLLCDPAASASVGIAQGPDFEKAATGALVANPSAPNRGPSNPNDESAAQMSAVLKTLGPAPPVSPQDPFKTNRPAANRGPSNPNDESAAQMSALHKALGPAPLVSPQDPLKTNQPAANQPASPPGRPNAAVAPVSSDSHTKNGDHFPQPITSDHQFSGPSKPFVEGVVQSLQPVSNDPPLPIPDSSSLSVENDVQSPQPPGSEGGPPKSDFDNSPPPNTGTFSTTIRLGPQTGSKPATIFLGSEVNRDPNNFGSAASINGDAVSAPSPKDRSGTKTSVTDVANPMVIVAGNALTITDPSSVSIAGTVLTPGGAEATIAGTPVSLASGGNLVIGAAAATLRSAVITAGGHTFTAHSAGFAVAGTTVAAGGPAVLLAGTEISLGTSGVLVVGSSTTTLTGSSPPSVFTVGGQSFTANPKGFTAAGNTLVAGGPGLTISGTPISLNPSGSLVVGTSTIPMGDPPPSILTTDGRVLTLPEGGRVAVNGATLTDGELATSIGGIPMRVHSENSITGTSAFPSPTINASISTTSDASSSNPTSTNPLPVPPTAGTSQPKAAAASKEARAPSAIWRVFCGVALVLCIF